MKRASFSPEEQAFMHSFSMPLEHRLPPNKRTPFMELLLAERISNRAATGGRGPAAALITGK
jgi:hypothetical protein